MGSVACAKSALNQRFVRYRWGLDGRLDYQESHETWVVYNPKKVSELDLHKSRGELSAMTPR